MEKGVLYCFIELEVKDKHNKIIDKRRFKSRSFVANFLAIIRRLAIISNVTQYGQLTTSDYYAWSGAEPVDVDGNTRPIFVGVTRSAGRVDRAPILGLDAGIGVTTHGIRVGQSDMPVSPTQFKLYIPIEEGTGSNQLNHGATTIDSLSISDNTITLRIIRTFTNNSPASITVREIGLFALVCYTNLSPYYTSFMLARDVISPVTIPVGSTLTVRYILRTTT